MIKAANRNPADSNHRLRQWLKHATADDHARLDDLVASWRLVDTDVYRRFLLAHAAVVLPLESWLETAGAGLILEDWQMRRRSDALKADLAALDAARQCAEVSRRDITMFFDTDVETQIGMLYVLEGSRLGGFVLASRIERENPYLPVSFLSHGSGRDVRGGLSTLFMGYAPDLRQSEKMISSARNVFSLYRSAFSLPVANGLDHHDAAEG